MSLNEQLQKAYDEYALTGDSTLIFEVLKPLMEGTAVQQIQRFPGRGFDADDIVQFMAVRILLSLPRYDPSKSTLATYLYPRIRLAVFDLDDQIHHSTAAKGRRERGEPPVSFVPLSDAEGEVW